MSLMITRHRGESIRIGDSVVTFVYWSREILSIRIDAPPEIEIVRSELVSGRELPPLADRLVAGMLRIEQALAGKDRDRYAPILEQTRAMIRREEMNT